MMEGDLEHYIRIATGLESGQVLQGNISYIERELEEIGFEPKGKYLVYNGGGFKIIYSPFKEQSIRILQGNDNWGKLPKILRKMTEVIDSLERIKWEKE